MHGDDVQYLRVRHHALAQHRAADDDGRNRSHRVGDDAGQDGVARDLDADGAEVNRDDVEGRLDVRALVVVTEWEQFRDLDLAALRRMMTTPILVDGRNLYTPESALAAGFDYSGVGRPGRGRALHEEAASLWRTG